MVAAMSAPLSPPRLHTLVLMSSLSVLTLTMFLPSLGSLAEDFAISYGRATLAFSGYLVASAALQLLFGPLSDRYGRRPVALGAILAYTFASLGCALAPNFAVFLIFRLIQSAIIGCAVMAPAIIRDMYEPGTAARRLGLMAMVMSLAPLFGPMVGGVLETSLGWRASFYVYAVLGLALLALIWFDLGETNTASKSSFRAQMRGYPGLLAARPFWGYALCMMLSVGAFFAFLAGAPLVAGPSFDLNAAQLGLVMGGITGAFGIGNAVSVRLAGRHGLFPMILAGRLVAVLGLSAALAGFLIGPGGLAIYMAGVLCVGLSNGLTMPSANAGVLSVRPDLAGSAAGLSGAMIVAGGAVVTSSVTPVLTLNPTPFRHLVILLLIATLALATLALVPRR